MSSTSVRSTQRSAQLLQWLKIAHLWLCWSFLGQFAKWEQYWQVEMNVWVHSSFASSSSRKVKSFCAVSCFVSPSLQGKSYLVKNISYYLEMPVSLLVVFHRLDLVVRHLLVNPTRSDKTGWHNQFIEYLCYQPTRWRKRGFAYITTQSP